MKIMKITIKASTIGVVYFLNQNAILSFFASFLKSRELSLMREDFSEI